MAQCVGSRPLQIPIIGLECCKDLTHQRRCSGAYLGDRVAHRLAKVGEQSCQMGQRHVDTAVDTPQRLRGGDGGECVFAVQCVDKERHCRIRSWA